jgi:putative ABC transport system permease protein
VWRDLAAGARLQARAPLATTAIVLILALGIAATSVSFSIVNSVFIRPLPIQHSERFVRVWRQDGVGAPYFPTRYRDFEDIRDLRPVFDAAAAEEPFPLILGVEGSFERVFGEFVSDRYFDVLGVRAALGRFPAPEEERSGEPLVVLSDGLWKRRFGGDRSALAQTITVEGRPHRIIGIAPAGFGGTILGFSSDLWIPRSTLVAADREPDDSSYFTIGRLAPGVEPAQAQRAVEILARRLARDRPDTNRGVTLLALQESEGRILPTFRGEAIAASALAIVASLLITLVACANVAGLLLARAEHRRTEIGVRLALGASPRRVAWQLLTESATLSMASGALGVALAWEATRLISSTRVVVARGAAVGFDVVFDWRVLAASIAVTVLSTIVFGLAPALEGSRLDLVTVLRQHEGRGGRASSWPRRLFLAAQVVVSMVLLAGAGLCVRSLVNGRAIDLGFDPTNVVTTSVDIGGHDETRDPAQFWSTLLDEVKHLPQTESASLTYRLPLELGMVTRSIGPDGFQPAEGRPWPRTEFSAIGTRFFDTLRIVVLDGRDFTDRDYQPDARVVILNDVLARRLWPDGRAVGRYVVDPDGERFEVVGVVRRSKYLSIGEAPKSYMYIPYSLGGPRAMTIVVRARGDAQRQLQAITSLVRRHDPLAALYEVGLLSSRVDTALAPATGAASSLTIVGAIALALTALGLFGGVAHAVGRRTYEIGVRRALGAPGASVVRLVAGETMALVAGGLGAGIVLSLIASRATAALLYEVDPLDPLALGLSPLILLVVCAAAVWLPTWRALRINAAAALRYE